MGTSWSEVCVGALGTVYLWSLPISQHKTILLDSGIILLKQISQCFGQAVSVL